MRLDSDGRIRELTTFFRPITALAVAARGLGSALGKRRSARRARLISLAAVPLVVLVRIGDKVGVRLVRPALPRRTYRPPMLAERQC